MSSTVAREERAAGPRLRRLALVGGLAIVACGLLLLAPDSYRMSIVLGIVQGLSEFLPISSSAHLILVPRLLGWPDPGLTYDVALHVGTLLAVVGYFWRDWLRLLGSAHRPTSPDGRIFWLIVLGTVPAGLAGILFEDVIERELRSLALIAVTLSVVGVLLWAVDRYAAHRREIGDIRLVDALVVGVAQAMALVPGTSRSGITITAGRMRGLSRDSAARFSFLLSTPVTAGAAVFKLRDLAPGQISGPFVAGIVVSALVGALAIGLLLRFIRRAGFGIFAVYRVLLALALLAFVSL